MIKTENGIFETARCLYEYAGHSDPGCVRSINEDDFLVAINKNLFAVADGVGGLPGGEIASKMALSALRNSISPSSPNIFTRLFRSGKRNQQKYLKALFEEANDSVFLSNSNKKTQSATTLVAVTINDRKYILGHVGDSRAYQFSENHLRLLTTDHTVAQEMAKHQKIGENSIFNNVITRAIGVANQIQPDVVSGKICIHDTLLLCSDGLTSMLPDTVISRILSATAPVSELAENLINAARKEGGRDNITVLLVRHVQ